jgi:hypothetical protein
MEEVGCLGGCGIFVIVFAGAIYYLFRIRLRIDGQVLRLTQYGGLWPAIGIALFGSVVIGLDRGSIVWAIVGGILALIALAMRPLWISTKIDRADSTFSNRQYRLLGIRRHDLPLDEIGGLVTADDSDIKGRASSNVAIRTREGETIDLIVNQASDASIFGRRGYERTMQVIDEVEGFLHEVPEEYRGQNLE